MSDPLDVTGSWEGIFSYPRALPPNGFRADLRETGGAVVGEVEERGDSGTERGATLHALVSGRRTGTAVAFLKTYDDAGRAHYAVSYAGTLSPDGDEIAGTWTIPGVWSGTFLMMRPARRAEPVAARLAQEVR